MTFTVVVAVAPPPASDAVMVAVPTAPPVIATSAVFDPLGMKTVAGTWAMAVFEEERLTTVSLGTGLLVVILMVAVAPTLTVFCVGLKERERAGMLIAPLTRERLPLIAPADEGLTADGEGRPLAGGSGADSEDARRDGDGREAHIHRAPPDHVHLEGRERLAEVVVELACDAGALLLLRRQEALRQRLQVPLLLAQPPLRARAAVDHLVERLAEVGHLPRSGSDGNRRIGPLGRALGPLAKAWSGCSMARAMMRMASTTLSTMAVPPATPPTIICRTGCITVDVRTPT